MNLDKQRIAAVQTLESLGYTWEGGVHWKPPLGKAPAVFAPGLDEALRIITKAHLDTSIPAGVAVRPRADGWPNMPDAYFDAWRTVCKHLGVGDV